MICMVSKHRGKHPFSNKNIKPHRKKCGSLPQAPSPLSLPGTQIQCLEVPETSWDDEDEHHLLRMLEWGCSRNPTHMPLWRYRYCPRLSTFGSLSFKPFLCLCFLLHELKATLTPTVSSSLDAGGLFTDIRVHWYVCTSFYFYRLNFSQGSNNALKL